MPVTGWHEPGSPGWEDRRALCWPPSGKARASQADKDFVRKCWLEGMAAKDIAAALGWTEKKVRNQADAMGLKRRIGRDGKPLGVKP